MLARLHTYACMVGWLVGLSPIVVHVRISHDGWGGGGSSANERMWMVFFFLVIMVLNESGNMNHEYEKETFSHSFWLPGWSFFDLPCKGDGNPVILGFIELVEKKVFLHFAWLSTLAWWSITWSISIYNEMTALLAKDGTAISMVWLAPIAREIELQIPHTVHSPIPNILAKI